MPSGIDVRSMIQGMQSRGATRESIRTMPLPPPARTPLNALTTSGGHPVGARLSNAAAVAPPIIPCTPLIAVGIMLDQTRRGPRREVVLPPRLRLEEQTSSSPCSPRTDRLTEGWWGVRSPSAWSPSAPSCTRVCTGDHYFFFLRGGCGERTPGRRGGADPILV